MNALLDSLLGVAGDVGYALDTPGAYLRGALAGDLGERRSGREMLESWGALDPNTPGLDFGDVAGFGAEALIDPLALAGPAVGAFKGLRGIGRATEAARGLAAAEDANPLLRELAGFLGDEEGALRNPFTLGLKHDEAIRPPQRIPRDAPEWVNERTFYHGTETPGLTPEVLDPRVTRAENLFGRGIYTTDEASFPNLEITRGYAGGPPDPTGGGPLGDWIYSQLGNQGLLLEKRLNRLGYRPSPEHFAATGDELLATLALAPESVVREQLAAMGVIVPDLPGPRLYRGQSDFGKILDLERANPRVVNTLVDFSQDLDRRAAGYAEQIMGSGLPPGVARYEIGSLTSLRDYLESFMERGAYGDRPLPEHVIGDLLGSIKKAHRIGEGGLRSMTGATRGPFEGLPPLANFPELRPIYEDLAGVPDALIRALRGEGYDALTHTGGTRTGKDYHQTVIGLDPNDVLGTGRRTPYRTFEELPPGYWEALR